MIFAKNKLKNPHSCDHMLWRITKLYSKGKYKHIKKGYNKLRFDIIEESECVDCGLKKKIKLKSGLTEPQAELFIKDYIAGNLNL